MYSHGKIENLIQTDTYIIWKTNCASFGHHEWGELRYGAWGFMCRMHVWQTLQKTSRVQLSSKLKLSLMLLKLLVIQFVTVRQVSFPHNLSVSEIFLIADNNNISYQPIVFYLRVSPTSAFILLCKTSTRGNLGWLFAWYQQTRVMSQALQALPHAILCLSCMMDTFSQQSHVSCVEPSGTPMLLHKCCV